MTSADMRKWLLKGSVPDINHILPAGVDIKLAILAGLNTCDDEELESVGAKFGLYRKAMHSLWEGNTAFSSRITDMVAQEVMDFRAKGGAIPSLKIDGESITTSRADPDWGSVPVCIHKWKKYVGIMDAFEFCEHCDEKRR